MPSQCQDAPLGLRFHSSLRNLLGIKHKTGMTKQENKRFTSMLLCLTSQGFNCQGLHWEPAGCKGMQISRKKGKGMQISSKRRKALFLLWVFFFFYLLSEKLSTVTFSYRRCSFVYVSPAKNKLSLLVTCFLRSPSCS